MSDFNETFNDLTTTADVTNQFDRADIQSNKAMGILAYISWLVLVPIFGAKDSKFARFHANQGLVLAIISTIVWIVFSLLAKIPVIGWIFAISESLISVGFVVLSVLGIVNAARGLARELPIVGKFKILK